MTAWITAVYRIAEIRGEQVWLQKTYCLKLSVMLFPSGRIAIAKAFTVTAAGLAGGPTVGILSPTKGIYDIFREEFPKIHDPTGEKKMTIDHVMRHHGGLSGGDMDIDAQGYFGIRHG